MLNSPNHTTMGGPSVGVVERGNIFSLQNSPCYNRPGGICKWQAFKTR